MSTIINALVGSSRKGTTIARQRTALKAGAVIQGAATAYLGLNSIKNLAIGNVLLGTACLAGAAIAVYNLTDMLSQKSNLEPAYDNIVARAKRIYKK